jgi:hypothetical protein
MSLRSCRAALKSDLPVRRDKPVLFQWGIDPPGNWFAPPGNNRSGEGGNEVVEAFDVKSRFSGSVNMQVVMRVNAEQASKRLTQKPTRPKDGEGRS